MIQQGHPYKDRHGRKHVALGKPDSAGLVRTVRVEPDTPLGYGRARTHRAKDLTPLPLRYLGDKLP